MTRSGPEERHLPCSLRGKLQRREILSPIIEMRHGEGCAEILRQSPQPRDGEAKPLDFDTILSDLRIGKEPEADAIISFISFIVLVSGKKRAIPPVKQREGRGLISNHNYEVLQLLSLTFKEIDNLQVLNDP